MLNANMLLNMVLVSNGLAVHTHSPRRCAQDGNLMVREMDMERGTHALSSLQAWMH